MTSTESSVGAATKATSSKQLGAAADLIRTLDEAFNSMSSAAKDAGSEAEMARRNAKLAGEIARRYGAGSRSTPARCSPSRVPFPAVQHPHREQQQQQPQQWSSQKKPETEKQERGHRARRPLGIDTGASVQPGEGMNPRSASSAKANGGSGVAGTPEGGVPSATAAGSPATPDAPEGGGERMGSSHRSLPSPVSSPQSAANSAAAGGTTTTTPRHVQGDRLAKAHAEDVLSLALELQRSREALDTERRSHEKTRIALREERGRAAALEAQIARLQSDLGSEAERYGREIDRLREENARANLRVQAAEEDAQAALDLAKGSAESREQVEGWLQRALNEIEGLRAAAANNNAALSTVPSSDAAPPPQPQPQPPTATLQPTTAMVHPTATPSASVTGTAVPVPITTTPIQLPRSSSSPPVVQYTASTTTTTTVTTTSEQTTTSAVYSAAQGQQAQSQTQSIPTATVSTPPVVRSQNDNDPRSRSMVAAGRDLFRKATTPVTATAASAIPEEHAAEGEEGNAYTLRLTKESADKRKKLRGLLANLGEGPSSSDKKLLLGPTAQETPSVTSASSSSSPSPSSSSRVDLTMRVTCNNVTKMLRESGARIGLGEQWWTMTTTRRTTPEGPEVEETARNFCNLVESKVSKQDEEFKEMEAFCDHLERKIANGGDFGA